jgi:hypothetical protein
MTSTIDHTPHSDQLHSAGILAEIMILIKTMTAYCKGKSGKSGKSGRKSYKK